MNKQTNKTSTGTGSLPSWVAGSVAALLMLMATGAGAATTNTYYVDAAGSNPQPPYDTWAKAATDIQTAVNLAQNDLVPGAIECVVLVTNGLYTLTESIVVRQGITLRSVNGLDVTAINGGYPATTNRCLMVTNCSAIISGFTVSNGFAYGEGVDGQGGGIFAIDATGIIENCLISKNRADRAGVGGFGGGMSVEGGTPIVRNCVIEGNSTVNTGSGSQRGTGVHINNSALLMYDCVVSNHVQAGNNGTGAGLYMFGSIDGIVSNCQFMANSCSRYGGGSYVHSGTVTHSVFSNNFANSAAGGFYLYGHTTGSKLLYSRVVNNRCNGEGGGVGINRGILENCVILNNEARTSGGGVSSDEGTIKNCLIAANEATTGSGGGLYRGNKSQVVRNCTIVQNKAGANGGGAYNLSTAANNFLNCIISGNSAPTSNDYYSATSAIGYSCAPELPEGVNGNTTNAPAFFDPGSGTGLAAVLGDFRLNGLSPCVDTGSNDVSVITTRDLNDGLRIRPLGGRSDMGCYEMPGGGPLSCQLTASPIVGIGPLFVAFEGYADGTNTVGAAFRWTFADGNVSDWSSAARINHTYAARSTPYAPMLEVTNAAGDTASRTITVPIQVYPAVVYVETNGAHVSPFDSWAKAATNLQDALDVAGSSFTAEAVVSNGLYRVPSQINVAKALTVRSASGNWADTIFAGTYPLTPGRVFNITSAGAVLDGFTITNGYLSTGNGAGIQMTAGTVRNCRVAENFAKGYGGGIYLSGARLENSVIENNGSQNSFGGGVQVSSGSVVSNCLITGNWQLNGSGGGLRVDLGTVVACTISSNSASAGGGIYQQGACRIENCRIISNAATSDGGGIYGNNGSGRYGTFRNCLIAGNTATRFGGGVWMAHDATFANCTLVGNVALTNGGFAAAQNTNPLLVPSTTNCIIYFNGASGNPATADIGGSSTNFAFSCSPALVDGVNGNRTADPRFVQAGQGYGLAWVPGDYRLWLGSPAADSGIYESWMADAVDLQGALRVQGAAPNMGAYEGVVLPPATLLLVR